MGTLEHDTMAYHARLANETRVAEKCQEQVEKWSDKELIEYIIDYCEDDFYDFIMEDLRLTHCRLQGIDPNFMPTKLGGIPNLLIELFRRENYLDYYSDLIDEQKMMVRLMVTAHLTDKAMEDLE